MRPVFHFRWSENMCGDINTPSPAVVYVSCEFFMTMSS